MASRTRLALILAAGAVVGLSWPLAARQQPPARSRAIGPDFDIRERRPPAEGSARARAELRREAVPRRRGSRLDPYTGALRVLDAPGWSAARTALPIALRNRLVRDADRLGQLFSNLIGNALKFTPEGGEVRVEAITMNDAVKVLTTDTGIGIPRDKWEAVFNKFEQVGAHKGPVKGTGLGLAICQQIIDRHRGRIWVESEEGVGSTFTFTLPLAQPDQAPADGRSTQLTDGDLLPARDSKLPLARAA